MNEEYKIYRRKYNAALRTLMQNMKLVPVGEEDFFFFIFYKQSPSETHPHRGLSSVSRQISDA